MDVKLLGNRIKSAREARDLSVDEVASAIGVNKSTISRYERGEIERPKLPVINSLANVLCVNPSWLIGKDENKTFTPNGMDLALFQPCSLFSALKGIRESFGYSANDVAFKIGISEDDYVAIEDGRDTSCLILSRLAVLFCCSTDHILSFDGVMSECNPTPQAILSVFPRDSASDYHVLSVEEAELIRMYRDLDSTGQATANVLLKGLLDIHPGEKAGSSSKNA